MKNYIVRIVFLVAIIFNISCNSFNRSKVESNKSSIEPFSNDELVIKNINTLDSLQGLWISQSDKESKILFKKNIQFHIYRKDTLDKSFVHLSNTCIFNKNDLSTNGLNGWVLIISDENSDSTTCYRINSLSNNELILLYGNKIIMYTSELQNY